MNQKIVIYSWPSLFFDIKSDRVRKDCKKVDTGPNESTYYYDIYIDDVKIPEISFINYSGWGFGSQAHYIPFNSELYKKLKEIYKNKVNIW